VDVKKVHHKNKKRENAFYEKIKASKTLTKILFSELFRPVKKVQMYGQRSTETLIL